MRASDGADISISKKMKLRGNKFLFLWLFLSTCLYNEAKAEGAGVSLIFVFDLYITVLIIQVYL